MSLALAYKQARQLLDGLHRDLMVMGASREVLEGIEATLEAMDGV